MSWVFGKCVVRQGVHYLDLEELTNVETSGKRIPLGGSCAGVWGDRRSWGDRSFLRGGTSWKNHMKGKVNHVPP